MTSLAIPSAPPPAAANIDGATSPANTDSRFGDALRESQAQPKAADDAHPHDPDTGQPPRKGADGDLAKQDDKTTTKDATVLPGMVPAVPVAPVPVRQNAAAAGKPVPAAGGPAGIRSAAPQPTPLSPHLVAGAPAVDAPIANAPVANVPGVNMPGLNAPVIHGPEVNAPGANASGAKPPVAQPDGTESTEPAPPDTDLAAAPSASDLKANPPVPDQHGDKTLQDSGPNAFAAQLVQLAGAHTGTAAAQPPPAPVQLTMQAAPGQPQFAQEAAQHVSWLAGQNIQQAEIQLNPKKLGPIQVEITTHHDRVDVSFAVQHPQTVHALQQTLPQLQHMLAQQGLNLGQASVGQQAPGRQHAAFAQHAGGDAGRNTSSAQADPPPTWRTARVAMPGRVDDFA